MQFSLSKMVISLSGNENVNICRQSMRQRRPRGPLLSWPVWDSPPKCRFVAYNLNLICLKMFICRYGPLENIVTLGVKQLYLIRTKCCGNSKLFCFFLINSTFFAAKTQLEHPYL